MLLETSSSNTHSLSSLTSVEFIHPKECGYTSYCHGLLAIVAVVTVFLFSPFGLRQFWFTFFVPGYFLIMPLITFKAMLSGWCYRFTQFKERMWARMRLLANEASHGFLAILVSIHIFIAWLKRVVSFAFQGFISLPLGSAFGAWVSLPCLSERVPPHTSNPFYSR